MTDEAIGATALLGPNEAKGDVVASTALPSTARSPVARSRRRGRRWLGIGLWLLVATAAAWGAMRWLYPGSESAPPPRLLPARVSALGRLAPSSEVIAVAPPTPTTFSDVLG